MSEHQSPSSYIQHPADMPLRIEAQPTFHQQGQTLPLGLICNTEQAFTAGTPVRITSPRIGPEIRSSGIVVWCRRQGQDWQLGVGFFSSEELYRIRMLEQICHIDHYRQLQRRQGQRLSPETAAQEWIEKFAAHFPTDGL
ncbi:hypothetical protein [Marinobacterium litorale]|uniref:hypothetical protein n=1 Tax=Marinobacterium litorale TaxID=404770 RepID=UPI0003FD68BC|nr:hypothetical protein [Marinobacterium litorale]